MNMLFGVKLSRIRNKKGDTFLYRLQVASAIEQSNQFERDLIAVSNLALYIKRNKKADDKL